MTEKIYYENQYIQEFDAAVLECEKEGKFYQVLLDRTAFYPEGGGQPSDTGVLGEASVAKVLEKSGKIYHETDLPLEPGSRVHGRIDWKQRFDNMQNHCGEHILSGLIHEKYGFDNVGFHMGKELITLDINGVLNAVQIRELENHANEVIMKNLRVRSWYPKPEELAGLSYRSKKELEGMVRIVDIPGTDSCACCGTHVAFTGEIGLLKITGFMKYKAGTRISMLCGTRALFDYQKKQEKTEKISNLLSAKPEEIDIAAERLKNEAEFKTGKIIELYRLLFMERAKEVKAGTKRYISYEEKLAPVQLRSFADLLMEKAELVFLYSQKEEGSFFFAAGSRSLDMKKFSEWLGERLKLRGGGSKLLVQGTVFCTEKELEQVLSDWQE